jgi:predicted anti-sigma-YlaC factor YlaD
MPSNMNTAESIRDSSDMAEVCLKFINILTLGAAAGLVYVVVDVVFLQKNGFGIGAIAVSVIAALLVLSAVLGWKAADGDDERNNRANALSKAVRDLVVSNAQRRRPPPQCSAPGPVPFTSAPLS